MYNDDVSDNFKSESNEKFIPKEVQILARNKKFYSSNKKYITSMIDIIDGKSNISIRILDWFVANYSKKYNTHYKINIKNKCELFFVYNEYKNQLNGYSKQYFDPFCRKKKVIYTYDFLNDKGRKEKINFKSSIGQLNFFQWAIRFHVIKYVERHFKEIKQDMNDTTKKNKEKKLKDLKKKKFKVNYGDIDKKDYNVPDPVICDSDKINSICISSVSDSSSSKTKSDSKSKFNLKNENKSKRQQLSKSVYDYGIKKYDYSIKMDFE
ncbi:hypothetical protein QLL95_gp1100 [Cotonvirus japonicus]|uniref:Uncharacterized protein n=1 Tax=Cotonvirus japonicus TaxID=2811091 RepID=A0ABM7NS90_9VIRU|nr:hypothetical protein QLL95_gp1100 [Cotonvirus japonicus]BCS83023.1 hypothetical protein [Cotonvirus japonicus]